MATLAPASRERASVASTAASRAWHGAAPYAWLLALVVAGVASAILYPGSIEYDGGAHYLVARWATQPGHHALFVDVWGRPLFTLLYALPALAGYAPAKLVTVAVWVATAWQSWRVAQRLGLERSPLVIPLLVLQPVVGLLISETLTEPLFALVLIVALRLHLARRTALGALVASLLVLARPEGFFVALLWSIWILADRRAGATDADRGRDGDRYDRAPSPGAAGAAGASGADRRGIGPSAPVASPLRSWRRRLATVMLLGVGAALWWLAALAITHDPLFIKHDWPGNWGAARAAYGTGSFWQYWHFRGEIVGPLLEYPFLVGLALLLARRRNVELTSLVLFFFLLHSAMRAFGLFGDAGYPRYFVCIAPAIALITLVGWNAIADAVARVAAHLRVPAGSSRGVLAAATAVVLLASLRASAREADDITWSRDARAVAHAGAWLRAHPVRVDYLFWSQEDMAAWLGWDPARVPPIWAGDRSHNLQVIRDAPPGTLVFWDAVIGPTWYGLTAADFAAAGYRPLHAARYTLRGYLPHWLAGSEQLPPRGQEMHLLYR